MKTLSKLILFVVLLAFGLLVENVCMADVCPVQTMVYVGQFQAPTGLHIADFGISLTEPEICAAYDPTCWVIFECEPGTYSVLAPEDQWPTDPIDSLKVYYGPLVFQVEFRNGVEGTPYILMYQPFVLRGER